MARLPKPWWRKDRRSWFVTIDGVRHNLGKDRTAAFQKFHELMAQPQRRVVMSESVASLIDAFLDWTQKHRAERTTNIYAEVDLEMKARPAIQRYRC